MKMKTHRSDLSGQDGFALIYMAATLTVLLLFTGVAVDSGRAYVVKAQLSKAVDGAALAAARNLNSGSPKAEATVIFKANFPNTYMGTASGDPTAAANFFKSTTDAVSGVNVVTVTATVVMPTSFMRLGNLNQVQVTSTGEATRRMVDLSLVLDVSGSIGSKWDAVRDAARTFVNSFDASNDRMALVTFSNGSKVLDQMPSSRGFAKTTVMNDIPNTLPGGSTLMVEGLYRGWDELRSVSAGQQSGLRIIVLFTDGASNGVPGNYDAALGTARSLRTADFPKNYPDPDSMTWDAPSLGGLADTQSGVASPSVSSATPVPGWNSTYVLPTVQWLPLKTWHAHSRSAGIPTQFDLQTSTLMVNGTAQNAYPARRGLRNKNVGTGRYPADVYNTNNAARNVLEIIANEARNDNGDYKIRIYTIGMGELVRYDTGVLKEKAETILMRISNDATSPDFNPLQLEGKYFFAQTEADVAPAFEGIQNQILRLTK
jgi:Mg-chelatase subunit ChlD